MSITTTIGIGLLLLIVVYILRHGPRIIAALSESRKEHQASAIFQLTARRMSLVWDGQERIWKVFDVTGEQVGAGHRWIIAALDALHGRDRDSFTQL